MNVFVLIFVILVTTAKMPNSRISNGDCQYVGYQKGLKWLNVVECEDVRANTYMLWKCEASVGPRALVISTS